MTVVDETSMNRRSKRTRTAVVGGILAVAALVFLLAVDAGPHAAPKHGVPAPEFAFEDINPASPTHGETLTLSELYAERGLVLQFIASWCGPCRKELPEVQKLHASGRAAIVLVAADEQGYTEGVLIVAERTGVTTPILFVPKDHAPAMERDYDYEILPATYLIDRAGTIRDVHQGAQSMTRLSAAIDRVLN